MKRNTLILSAMLVLLASIFMGGCKSSESALERQQRMAKLRQNIETQRYVFTATSAIPLGFRQVHLTSEYTLKISPDTIQCHLPYFGRGYVAPINPDETGINFTSTDFEYEITEKKDTWEIRIKPNDHRDVQQLFLSVGNTGFANLSVQQVSRQAISFSGTVE